jgi:hypothetical protein
MKRSPSNAIRSPTPTRALSEEQHEVTLTGQRVVVGKETVPVERVRLGAETVT